MNKSLCLLSIALLAVGFAAQSQSTVLTLDDCLRIALSENPTIKIADMEVDRADYSKIETISQLLPNVAFAGQYSRTLAKQVMYMNMDFGSLGGATGGDTSESQGEGESSTAASRGSDGGNRQGIKVGLDNTYSVGFSASLPLIAPQLWASLKISDTQILAAAEQARASKLDMVNQVKTAYYELMLAADSREVIQQSYDMAALTHDIYTKKYSAGAASDYDVLRTSVAMKNIEPQLLQAEIAIKKAKLKLQILMGMGSDVDFEIAGRLKDYENSMYEETLGIVKDYSQNSQLILNEIQQKQSQQALTLQKNSLYPTLAMSFNYMWNSMSNGSPLKNFVWTPYSTLGLQLSIPIFTGGSRYSKIKQAQIQVEELKWTRENLQRNVAMQVDLAVDNIKINVEQIASCSESVGQATRAHDIMEKSFQIGAASYLDLRDSELALTNSHLTYYQAIYNYLIARSQLELLLGNAKLDY